MKTKQLSTHSFIVVSCILKKTHLLSSLRLYKCHCKLTTQSLKATPNLFQEIILHLQSILEPSLSLQRRDKMSGKKGKGPKVDLKLDLSLSMMRGGTSRRRAGEEEVVSPNNSSSPSSCVSSEAGNSPEATSMMLLGCPRCLMYVMLADKEPKCPKCKSNVLLDFNNNNNNDDSSSSKGKGKKNRKG